MWKLAVFTGAIGQDLVGADGDGANLFALAGILSDLVWGDGGFIAQFADPLAHGDGIGRQDKGTALKGGDQSDADQCFARPTGQDNDAAASAGAAAEMKGADGCFLIRA